ncbi:MAG: hypothetical protein U5K81_11850 [Trueperaceae bacterium]|nr:hypothetical protein [Trueperaceae bacterium]
MTQTPTPPRSAERDTVATHPSPRQRGVLIRGAAITVLCIALAACSDVASQRGGLTVEVTGLPSEAVADVTVHGASGDPLPVAGSGLVANAAEGTYTVRAAPVHVDDVTYHAEPAEQRVRVEDGDRTTARISYAPSSAVEPSERDDTDMNAAGVTRGEMLQGVLWTDRDGDGRFGRGDTVAPDARVYLDLDGNERRDEGEPSVRTDGAGQYRFEDLTPGTNFVVRHQAADDEDGGLGSAAADRASGGGATHHVWFGAALPAAGDAR